MPCSNYITSLAYSDWAEDVAFEIDTSLHENDWSNSRKAVLFARSLFSLGNDPIESARKIEEFFKKTQKT